MQITHVSEPNGAQSKKKVKFRKNGFANVVSDFFLNALFAVKVGRPNQYFLRE